MHSPPVYGSLPAASLLQPLPDQYMRIPLIKTSLLWLWRPNWMATIQSGKLWMNTQDTQTPNYQQMQEYFRTIGRWSHEWPMRNAIGSLLLCTFATHSSNFVTSDVSSCMAEALGTPATTCILKKLVTTKLGDTRIWFSVELKSVCHVN